MIDVSDGAILQMFYHHRVHIHHLIRVNDADSDLWMCILDFFEHLDRICGCALRIETSIADLSVYLATAVDWIRRDQPSFDKT